MTDIETCSLGENVDEYFMNEDEDYFLRNYRLREREAEEAMRRIRKLMERYQRENREMQERVEKKKDFEQERMEKKLRMARERNKQLQEELKELMREKHSFTPYIQESTYHDLSS